MDSPQRTDAAHPGRLPRGIWALGLVSLLMDTSSEMIHSLLPLYLTTVLGAPVALVGVIEGLAEATAAATRIVAGALADWAGRRKGLALAGYGLAAAVKPVFPLAGSVAWVTAARVLDRIGKGVRGAPRDALVAELAPPALRGAAFGLRQSLDTVGAVLGPLLALTLLAAGLLGPRGVLWVAVLPAGAAVAVLALAVHEPPQAAGRRPLRFPLQRRELARLGGRFWAVAAAASILALARISEAFLLLQATATGLPATLVPGVLAAMNVVYAVAAYPAGVLADRHGRVPVLLAGTASLAAAGLVLALRPDVPGLVLGVALWGIHMALTQGVLAALVVDTCPPPLRGTALGAFGGMTAAALLAGSAAAGWLWDVVAPGAAWLAVAVVASAALAGFAVLCRPTR